MYDIFNSTNKSIQKTSSRIKHVTIQLDQQIVAKLEHEPLVVGYVWLII